ncbi:serine O-acetyltransferase [Lentzea fradiae]|uniref:Serine acetyltransferase n=1 Tax=Lentzea fradiae TaxID=200378 RepID=A0A1G7UP83_9PSEU|nr:serine O-acetyltransferase EpsC [Lentzea fradiae]SDG49041.1 serine O-acetyltransferase [Lentzea fradiae]
MERVTTAAPAPGTTPRLLRLCGEDWNTVVARDPSIRGHGEGLLHPALPAMWTHRVAHRLHQRGLRRSARTLMWVVRAVTGVEIHPGARLGRRVFIDHGAAVVIGETAVVGDDVTIYHEVTLGAVGWWRDNLRPPGERRHPQIGDRVVLGVGATVLGPVVIGADSVIGARALVVADVPDKSLVLAPTATTSAKQAPRRRAS